MAVKSDVLILLRHALAGTKLDDPELDFLRGLDPVGRATANSLPDLVLEHVRPTFLASSPFARCIETVEPFAEAVGLPVLERGELAPAATPDAFEQLLLSAPNGAVLCTHGEVIKRVFKELECEKGAFFVIHRQKWGLHLETYVAPPALPVAPDILRARGRRAAAHSGELA